MTEQKEKRQYKKRETNQYAGFGKLAPQAIELENAILGAMLSNTYSEAIYTSAKPEIFYNHANKLIATAIQQLRQQANPIDLLSVQMQLKTNGDLETAGGLYYLMEVEKSVNSTNKLERHVSHHIAIVHEKFLSRELIRLATEMTNNCYDDTSNPLAEMGAIITQIDNLKRGIFKRTDKSMAELGEEARAERKRPKAKGLLGISTGSKGLDKILHGYQPNQLIIIAARPGQGKTATMCSQMLAMGYREHEKDKHEEIAVAGFSLEMTNVSLYNRMLANVSSIPTDKIKKNELTQQEQIRLEEYEKILDSSKIILDDTPGITIDEFEAKVALLVATKNIKAVFIDYLQLMSGSPNKKYGNREAEVSDISKRLKRVAKELNIPVIALSQLSRAVESVKPYIPQLSHLRESGSLEQDADAVIFLYRPEYYEDIITALEEMPIKLFNFTLTEFKGLMINIVAKCREHETGKVPLKCDLSIMRVTDHQQVLDALGRQAINQIELTTEQREAQF